MLKKAILVAPILIAILVWWFFYSYEQKYIAKDVKYPCVSYAPYNIVQKERYKEKELRKDLQKIKQISNCVRIYGVTNGMEQIPAIADTLGMEVIIGAWLDADVKINEKEIDNLIKLAQNSNNIKFVIVGNETLLMKRITKEVLFKTLDKVNNAVSQPVTTSEPIELWMLNPELEEHVDFIGLHKFPFWEEVHIDNSLESMKVVLADMEAVFSKPLVVLEIGWPTNGVKLGEASPGFLIQRRYLKETGDFLASKGMFYNVADGLDVPSKLNTTEGLVGLHWGILTYDGKEKHIFPFSSLIIFILLYAGLYSMVYMYSKPVLKKFNHKIKTTEYVFILSSLIIAYMLMQFYRLYLNVSPLFQICFTFLAIYGFFECINKYVQLRYAQYARDEILTTYVPYIGNDFVSVLVAAKNEASDQIIKTLQSLIDQTYEHVEVLYLDNNSENQDSFKVVSDHFKNYNKAKLKLFYKKDVVGYKAGALNYLLTKLDTRSKFVAVIDSDYIVSPDWIKTSLGYVKPDTGFVQFPQSYKIGQSSYNKKNIIEIGATVEQRFVFDIVYPVRSFIGDVVQNGTMVMINCKYLTRGWPIYSICEDAALGLNISILGGKSVYVPTVMGQGTAPHTFSALRKQRNRWVFGAVQILQKSLLYPSKSFNKTLLLFFIDWLGWLVQGLYPLLLISSTGYILFLWLVYLHIHISWVMLVGFVFVALSLSLFIVTYFQNYKMNTHKYLEIISLLLIEFGLVNTISKTVLTGFLTYKARFVTTRQIGNVKVYDLSTIAFTTFLIWITIFLCVILFWIHIPVSAKILGFAQLSVVMLPQLAYAFLRVKY